MKESIELFSTATQSYPRLIRELRGVEVQSLAAGHVCSGCVDANGQAYTWGANHFWQLGFAADRDLFPLPTQARS